MARLPEKSRLKSRLPSPFLHRLVFLFYFPFLVSPLLFGGSGVTVFALFFIFFHPSSVAHSSHWKEASLTQEDGKDVPSFYTIRHTSSLLDTSFPRFCQRQAQCQSRCSIRDTCFCKNKNRCYIPTAIENRRLDPNTRNRTCITGYQIVIELHSNGNDAENSSFACVLYVFPTEKCIIL